MSTFEHAPHPRLDARLRARPVQRSDGHVGFNGRLGAWMTRRLGTVWSVYLVSTFVLGWMIVAQAGPLRFDRFPFPFMLFLGNVVQLLLIFVILVGQQVLGATAERRALETFDDAEAILHEVEQIHAHLLEQDRILKKGINLCDVRPEPWTEPDPIDKAVRIPDPQIGFNGRVAASLTRVVGTMWTFYAATIFQFG